jgi:iron complex outermembrane receptor protein
LGDFTLTSVSGYERSDRHVLQDGNGAPSTLYSIDWGPSRFEQVSQEFRLSSPDTGRFKWIVGAFFFAEDGAVHNFYNLADAAAVLGFEAFDQFYKVTTNDWAVFAHSTFDISDRLTLTTGARYTYEERSIDHQTFLSTAQRVHLNPATLTPAEIPFVNADLEDSWSEVSGRVALDYQFTPDIMAFASVNRGFTAGGFNSGSFTRQDLAETPYDPEELTSYEIGLKTTLFDRRARFNITAFYYDYSDLQVFLYTATNDQYIANASNAEVYGLEFELQTRFTPNWELNASLGLLSSEYQEFVQSGVDLSGNRLVGSPEVQGNIMSQYTVPLSVGSVTFRGDFTYTGERYYDERQFEEVSSQGSDTNLDAQAIFRNANDSFEFSLWARNLTDEVTIIDIVDVGAFGWQNVWYNAPRTYGVEIAFKF